MWVEFSCQNNSIEYHVKCFNTLVQNINFIENYIKKILYFCLLTNENIFYKFSVLNCDRCFDFKLLWRNLFLGNEMLYDLYLFLFLYLRIITTLRY